MDACENKFTTEQQAAFERCVNFLVELLEKYSNENIIADEIISSKNIHISENLDESVA